MPRLEANPAGESFCRVEPTEMPEAVSEQQEPAAAHHPMVEHPADLCLLCDAPTSEYAILPEAGQERTAFLDSLFLLNDDHRERVEPLYSNRQPALFCSHHHFVAAEWQPFGRDGQAGQSTTKEVKREEPSDVPLTCSAPDNLEMKHDVKQEEEEKEDEILVTSSQLQSAVAAAVAAATVASSTVAAAAAASSTAASAAAPVSKSPARALPLPRSAALFVSTSSSSTTICAPPLLSSSSSYSSSLPFLPPAPDVPPFIKKQQEWDEQLKRMGLGLTCAQIGQMEQANFVRALRGARLSEHQRALAAEYRDKTRRRLFGEVKVRGKLAKKDKNPV